MISPVESVTAALNADYASSGFSAILLGILTHVTVIRPLPVEEYLGKIFTTYAVSTIILGYAYRFFAGLPTVQTLARVAWGVSAFNVGLFFSITVYRAFFHPLHHFPGPFLSKVSRFYDAYLAGRDLQYHVELERLHQTYGDFVRTGPRELSIADASAVPLIYGPSTKCKKSTFYAQVDIHSENVSVHQTRDVEDHRLRRKAWDRGLSIKALNDYVPRIQSKANKLVSYIKKSNFAPIDVTAWAMFLSFDIMGDVGFGKEFDNLGTGVEHPAIKAIHDHMGVLGTMGHLPWLINILNRIPGAVSKYSSFFDWCGGEIERKWQTWDKDRAPQDIVSWLLKAYWEKDVSAPPSREALDQDGRIVIIAGSDTTSTTLAAAVYFLSKYPAVLQKLQTQIDEMLPEGLELSYDNVKSITYLDNIIQETLRLRPPVMTMVPRVTPPEGITVQGRHVPGDMNVFVPAKFIQEDERYYSDAKAFIPERWGERKELRTPDAPYFPFSLGSYGCPGKSLALMSLKISLSSLAHNFDFGFLPGEDGGDFETKILDTFTTGLPPLQIQFSPRQ